MTSKDQPLKILFVIPYFYPAWQYGGQPRSSYELARGLVQRGHQVTVLTTDSGGSERLNVNNSESDGFVDGIRVKYYRNLSNTLAYKHRVFLPPQFYKSIRKEVAACDILHIHELRSTVSVPAYRAAKLLKKPFILSTHGGLQHLGKAKMKSAFDAIWGRRMLRDAAALAAISSEEEKDGARFAIPPGRIRRLPNAVRLEDYSGTPQKGLFRKQWNMSSPIILFLGRLNWVKGADILIKAFQKFRAKVAAFDLVIAGPDDGQEAELRRLVRDLKIEPFVKFTGFLDDTAKRQAFADSRLLVIPSRSEVFAITALESLLCGTPVLVSSACGLSPLPGPECGLNQFKVGDVDDLVCALEKMAAADACSVSIEAARNYVQREFSAESVAATAESIYKSVLYSGVVI